MFEEALSAGVRMAMPVIIIVVLGVVATAFLKYWRPPARKAPVTYPYARCAALFSQTEQRLLWALREAVPQLQVFGKVRMEDVIVVRRDLPKSAYVSARNRIKSRHLDFVLVEPTSSWIVCAIELDDASHDRASARLADNFKDRALEAAGVPLLRIRASASYSSDELARRIQEVAGLPGQRTQPVTSSLGPFELPDG